MSTYNWNISQSGNIRLTGKMVPAGVDPYPLLSAGSLDWDGVEIESGKSLNTTDDLLNYIKSVKTTNTLTWTDEDLESATTGYELRCNKSVCYKGDTLSNVPITIWKSNGSQYVEIDYETATSSDYQLSLVEERPDVSASILLTWNASKSSLSGTVNYVGPYVFKLMKGTGANAVEVARHVLTVLTPLYKTKVVYVYKHSDSTITTVPVGGTYNFSTGILNPTPDSNSWSTSPSGLTGPIWVSSGFVSEESPNNISWNLPSIYLTHELTSVEDDHMVKEFAVYKAAVGPYTTTENNQTVQHNKQKPAAPIDTNCYSFSTNTFTPPTGWFNEPEAAIAAYKDNQSDSTLKSNYRVWKTYNSYRITAYNGVLDNNTYSEGTWSAPVEYLNIDKILEDAKTQSQKVADDAIRNARADLAGAEDLETIIDAVNSIFAWSVVEDGANTLPSKYEELVDGASGSDAHILFQRFDRYIDSQTNKYTGTLESVNNNPNLCVSGYQMKAIKFDPLSINNSSVGSKWIAYIPTTTEIRDQISTLNQQTQTLSTAVNAMNPDQIRLQVSKGFKNDVTWTEIDYATWNSARVVMEEDPDDEQYDLDYYYISKSRHDLDYAQYKRHQENYDSGMWSLMSAIYNSSTGEYDFLSALPQNPYSDSPDPSTFNPGGYIYGHYYRVHFGPSTDDYNSEFKYYRCDYPISTGFLNVLAERVSLGIERSTTPGHEGANLTFSFNDRGSNAAITATNIVLNGNTIADAIFGKSLNINNTTYLCSDGDVYMGVPNDSGINPDASDKTNLNTGGGSSRFNNDGSGQLAGGNIHWSSNGSMWIKDAYIGNSNVWHIGQNSNSGSVPFIEANDDTTHRNLIITPTTLYVLNTDNQDDHEDEKIWEINRGGDAHFAYNNAYFAPNGDFRLGYPKSTSGTQNGGGIFYKEEDGTLQIYGPKVKLASDVQLELQNGSNAIALNQLGTNITGSLNTEDLSVGNGACFFKGDDNSESTSHGAQYTVGSAGAGHLANGNVKWDKNGNVSVKGNIEADSMKINAVASYSDAASLGTGKMWFTNYGSAKNISHGEIQNANVSLRDDDPVILFKRERTVGSGVYDFFVLNPLLLSNGSTETRTTQIGFLDDSIPSSTPIRMLVNDKIVKRWTRSGAITKVVTSTPGSSDVTRYISNDQGGYLFMFRVVDAANCLYKDDNNVLVYHPITGAEPRSLYDSVIEITALYCQSPNAHILYDTIYLYPAYAGNGSRRYSTNTGNVGYYISTSIKQETLSSGTTVYDIVADTQKTLRASKEVYVMQKTNINGHSDVVYLNSGYNYGTLLTSNVSLANDSSCTVYSQRQNSGYADSYTTSTFAWNCESGLTPSDLV